jgi:polar amino acid transport system substrate-binding protein
MRRVAPLVVAAALAGCQVPADPDGTLERVRGGTMRVGITTHIPWTEVPDRGAPRGVEVTLVQRFARSLNARVRWREGAEAELVEAMKAGELDLVVGGLTGRSPWHKEVALTRPYLRADGEKHVLAAPLGENAWLVRLERFLLDRESEARRLLEAAR